MLPLFHFWWAICRTCSWFSGMQKTPEQAKALGTEHQDVYPAHFVDFQESDELCQSE